MLLYFNDISSNSTSENEVPRKLALKIDCFVHILI